MRPPLCKLLALVTLSLASVSSPVTAGGQQALRTPGITRQVEPNQPDLNKPLGQVQGWGQSGVAIIEVSGGRRAPAQAAAAPPPPSVTVSPRNVTVRTPRPQNTESQARRTGPTRAATRTPAPNPLVRHALEGLQFDMSWGYLDPSQGDSDTNYRAARALFDLNRDLPWLYALASQTAPTAAPRAHEVAAGDTPADITETIWNWVHQTPVATPQPTVQAGRGIPGLLTYLETGMDLAMDETVESPAGPLIINGAATLTVDWGDGEIQTGITDPGGPYPDGQLTHHYPNSGDYTISVTANWLLTWNLAGNGGIIPLQTSGTIQDFPVRALRAVARPVSLNDR